MKSIHRFDAGSYVIQLTDIKREQIQKGEQHEV